MLVYDIAVFFGSLPFVFVLGWRPQLFGLNRFMALSVGMAICLDAYVFPWVLHYGWVRPWLALSALFIVLVSIFAHPTADQEIANTEKQTAEQQMVEQDEPVPLGKDRELDVPDTIDANERVDVLETPGFEVAAAGESCVEVEPLPGFESEMNLEELLDRGFAAKQEGDLPAAARWFAQALALGTSPDIAFYLLTDIYWLGMVEGQPQFALEQLRRFGAEYYRMFTPPLRQQFRQWLQRENIDHDGLFNIEGDIL